MRAPASSTANIDFGCTLAEFFGLFKRMENGTSPPSNFITDINPYRYAPSNLPAGIWYFLNSKENIGMEYGLWKTKEEACEIFSDASIIGWRTTLEFHEGQAPNEHKTSWIMQEFTITQKRLSEDGETKEAGILCRIFLDGEQNCNLDKQENKSGRDIRTESHDGIEQLIIPVVDNNSEKDSSSSLLVKEGDKIEEFPVAGKLTNYSAENLPEVDYFSRGDYLELLDLDNPASSSSSSENSSRFSLSSDEYFDSLALLQDLSSENSKDIERRDANCKFNISEAHRLSQVVTIPATSAGTVIDIGRTKSPVKEMMKADCFVPGDGDNIYLKHTQGGLKVKYVDEGPSSNSHNVAESLDSPTVAPYGERKYAVGRMKKLKKKYLCFIPF